MLISNDVSQLRIKENLRFVQIPLHNSAILKYFVLNSVLRNNSALFKYRLCNSAISLLFNITGIK
jgi:hypothetical protein